MKIRKYYCKDPNTIGKSVGF